MKSLVLEDLTIEQKIGQMLLCRSPIDAEDKEFILELLRNKSLGGIHLGYRFKDDIPELLEAAGYPVLICENMEFGYEESCIKLPSPMAVSATDSEEMAYEFGRMTAIEAKTAGYNVVFGPIVDIAMNPLSSCVGPRAYGGDKETVARMATASIKGYQDQGMIVTAKHFPGFGESPVDSHIGMLYLKADEELLTERELYAYVKATEEADLSGVMVGHIMVPKVDPKYPASISPTLIGMLRKAGYNGLAMTDSLAMVGMTNLFGLEESHGLAMAAGNDMVMTSYRISAKTAYEYMLKAYKDGVVTEEQINEAAARVLEAQAKTLKQPQQKTLSQKDKDIAVKMSEDAITAKLFGVKEASISTEDKHLFILEVNNTFVDPETGESQVDDCGISESEELIKKWFPNSDIMKINEFPSRKQMEDTLSTTMKYDSIVMVTYNQSLSYMGSSDLTKRMLALMEGIAHKLSAVVLFGNPYAAREFPPVPRIIFGYDRGYCEEATFKVLSGNLAAKGKLPVNVEFKES